MMNETIKILFAEDQKLFRETMISMLKGRGIETLGEAADGNELLNLLSKIKCDILLLDLQMPGMDGNKAFQVIKVKYPHIKVIILTSFIDGALKADFKAKGVTAFLTKNDDFNTIVETIYAVHRADNISITNGTTSIFTKREIQIIPLLCKGKTSGKIANTLNISERTIEAHRKRLYEKTGSKNAADFSSYCTKAGLDFLGK
jgi:DNA-binding NarL/FixJ family response regulator